MSKWYKVGVKFTEQQEDSTFKRVKKMYLIQADSFMDAEFRTYENLKRILRGQGEVVSMARVNVHKIIEGESDQFFELTISFMQSDDSGKKEKKISHTIFMRADSAEDAVVGLRKAIKKEYPYYNLEKFSTSDIKFAYPLSGLEGEVVFDKAPNDDDEEEVTGTESTGGLEETADATAGEDFKFPEDLDKPEEVEEAAPVETTEEPKAEKTKPEPKPKAPKKEPAKKKDKAFEMPE